jgi:S-adenosylmethionine/arginine decarboxylase-like enzyme
MSHSPHSDGLVHQHFIIDAELKEPLNFDKRHEITRELIDALMDNLNMEELGPLQVYDAVDDEYPGWSFIQPITTSHISGHYFEEKNKPSHIHMDIYSCKEFDKEKLLEILNQYLGLEKWSSDCIFREINPNKRKFTTRSSVNF